MFKNLKNGTKLACSFGLIVVLLLAIAAATTLRIQTINERIADILDDRAVKVALATDLDQATNVQARFLRYALIGYKDAEEVRTSLERVEKAVAENAQTLARLEKMINTPIGQKLFKAMLDTREPYGKGRNEVVAMLKAGKVEEAGVHLLNNVRPAQNEFLAAIDAFSVAQSTPMPARSRQSLVLAAKCPRRSGDTRSESVAGLNRIAWRRRIGLTGGIGSERLALLVRNTVLSNGRTPGKTDLHRRRNRNL